jgi:hypothetical protein
MAKKAKVRSPFIGRWRIVSMSAWDDEYLDEEVQAFIELADKGTSSFQFGYVQGTLDHRTTNRSSEPAVEFSWEGSDGADGTPLIGRGWAVLKNDELHGEFFIHDGDDSEFIAKRGGRTKSAKSK